MSAAAAELCGAQTPWEEHEGILVKRDDLYEVAGVRGGKVRTCWHLATMGRDKGSDHLVTAGSRSSPQVNIVAQVGRELGMAVTAYTPQGPLGAELLAAREAGAEIVQVRAGYNSVIRARARDHCLARPECTHVPFGMECAEAVLATAAQVRGLPPGLKRLVVPVGSGMSLAGILWGLHDCPLPEAAKPSEVLAVLVGADPTKRLDAWAPPWWAFQVRLERSPLDYHSAAERCTLGGLVLDPIYEAKCLPYLQPGDGLWVVGVRQHT